MTRNWPKYLNRVITSINNSPNSAIGGIKPALIKSQTDGVIIDQKIGVMPDVPVKVQKENQKKYEEDKNLIQVGNFVYLDFAPSTMQKSFDTKRNQIYRVIRIDAGKSPPLYKLADLMKVPLKGYYYGQQLLKTTKPKKGEYFKVEKIVAEETRNGKEYVLVKYQHYSNKFNKWLPKHDILKGAK